MFSLMCSIEFTHGFANVIASLPADISPDAVSAARHFLDTRRVQVSRTYHLSRCLLRLAFIRSWLFLLVRWLVPRPEGLQCQAGSQVSRTGMALKSQRLELTRTSETGQDDD